MPPANARRSSPEAPKAHAVDPRLTTLYTFTNGADGYYPVSVAAGPHGSLVGTTAYGGAFGNGVAFQLTPPAQEGGTWAFNVIHSFTGGPDGGFPSELLEDASGNYFGETSLGGSGACQLQGLSGCGVVYELSPPAKGQSAWTETVLYNFAGGADGFYPEDGLVQDAKGNLYGTALQSNACFPDDCGTAFELSPPAPGQTAWPKTTLWTFARKGQGTEPLWSMVIDKAGRLFGILAGSGYKGDAACQKYGCGAVYMLTPPKTLDIGWKATAIWRFSGKDGIAPFTNLQLDGAGNLYGLTNHGGKSADCKEDKLGGCGTLYRLTPPASGHGPWSLSVLWDFTGGTDGAFPWGAGLLPFGDKYITTTSGDEPNSFGSIDLFTPSNGGGKWAEQTVFTFTDDANGENPTAPLFERNGTFYGLTEPFSSGSPTPYGTIYSFKP